MQLSHAYLVKKLIFSKADVAGGSPVVIRIAIAAIALGVAVMIISVAVVKGFQQSVRDKVAGFGAHITVSNYDNNESLEPVPIKANSAYINDIRRMPEVKNVQQIATKAGIMMVDKSIEGVVVKGVGSDFDWSFFNNCMVEGITFPLSDTAKTSHFLISKFLANRMKLTVGSSVKVFFIQGNQRLLRKFKVSGIYHTGFQEYDRVYCFADIAHIRRLNGWNSEQIGAIEINLHQFELCNQIADDVDTMIGMEEKTATLAEQKPWIFDWLNLLDTNAIILIVLMLIVSGINAVSSTLTLIIEKSSEIGLLKTLGMRSLSIARLFASAGWRIALKGLLIGNILAIGLLLIQAHTKVITLDEASYYVKYVPIVLLPKNILFINLVTLIILGISIAIPLGVIMSLSPLKAIKFN